MSTKEIFITRFDAFSRTRRGVSNAALRYYFGGWALGCGILSLLLLSGWLPSAFVNVILTAAAAAMLVVLLVKYARRRERFRRHLDEAFVMEDLAGGLNSRLISALDFAGVEAPSSLMQVVIDRAQEDLKADFERRLDRKPRNLFRKRFAGLLVVFIVLGLTPWFGFGQLYANFNASFFAVSEYLFPVVYEVSPPLGKHIFKLGKQVNVSITFAKTGLRATLFGGGYRQVTLVEKVGDQTVKHDLKVDSGYESGRSLRRAVMPLKGSVEAEHRLHFEFGERKSGEVIIVFSNVPVLENMQTELVYPAYTRTLPKSLEGVQDRFFGLPGTKITLGFTFSKDLASAKFAWDDGEELPLEVVGRFASTTFVHSRNRTASLQVEDVYGFSMEYPFTMNFEIQADEKPQVFLPRSLKNDMPTLAEGMKLFGFGARLEDDYGVSRCVLKWTKATVNNPTRVTEKGEAERLISPPRRKAIVAFEKVFENLSVLPGDKISFAVEVYDNRSPDPQMAVSPSRSLFIYQQGLEDLRIASLGFGSGAAIRARISQSKRATTVKEPMAMKTSEQVKNEFEARIDTATKAPVIPGSYAQPVKDYFRLMSTAVHRDDGRE